MLNRPGDLPGPFTPAELDGIDGAPDELAADRRVARELEGVADRGTVRPSADFAERVMAAIAAEPAPAPARAAGAAIRRGSLGAFLVSFRDAWRVSFGTGFPVAARVQALALILVVSGVLVSSGAVTAGALGVFTDRGPGPAPTQSTDAPVVTSEPTPPPTLAPAESTSPTNGSTGPTETGSPAATETPSPDPTETQGSGETPEATSGDGGSTVTRHDQTPRPPQTSGATDQPTPTDDGEDHGTPGPTGSPQPTEAPHTAWGPSPTPGP